MVKSPLRGDARSVDYSYSGEEGVKKGGYDEEGG